MMPTLLPLKLSLAHVEVFVVVRPRSFSSWNSGVSCSFRRMYSAPPTRTNEIRNGTRQPHDANVFASTERRAIKMRPSAANMPTVAVVWIQDV